MCARIAAQFLRYRNFVAAEDQVTAVFGLLHGVVTADIDRVPVFGGEFRSHQPCSLVQPFADDLGAHRHGTEHLVADVGDDKDVAKEIKKQQGLRTAAPASSVFQKIRYWQPQKPRGIDSHCVCLDRTAGTES